MNKADLLGGITVALVALIGGNEIAVYIGPLPAALIVGLAILGLSLSSKRRQRRVKIALLRLFKLMLGK